MANLEKKVENNLKSKGYDIISIKINHSKSSIISIESNNRIIIDNSSSYTNLISANLYKDNKKLNIVTSFPITHANIYKILSVIKPINIKPHLQTKEKNDMNKKYDVNYYRNEIYNALDKDVIEVIHWSNVIINETTNSIELSIMANKELSLFSEDCHIQHSIVYPRYEISLNKEIFQDELNTKIKSIKIANYCDSSVKLATIFPVTINLRRFNYSHKGSIIKIVKSNIVNTFYCINIYGDKNKIESNLDFILQNCLCSDQEIIYSAHLIDSDINTDKTNVLSFDRQKILSIMKNLIVNKGYSYITDINKLRIGSNKPLNLYTDCKCFYSKYTQKPVLIYDWLLDSTIDENRLWNILMTIKSLPDYNENNINNIYKTIMNIIKLLKDKGDRSPSIYIKHSTNNKIECSIKSSIINRYELQMKDLEFRSFNGSILFDNIKKDNDFISMDIILKKVLNCISLTIPFEDKLKEIDEFLIEELASDPIEIISITSDESMIAIYNPVDLNRELFRHAICTSRILYNLYNDKGLFKLKCNTKTEEGLDMVLKNLKDFKVVQEIQDTIISIFIKAYMYKSSSVFQHELTIKLDRPLSEELIDRKIVTIYKVAPNTYKIKVTKDIKVIRWIQKLYRYLAPDKDLDPDYDKTIEWLDMIYKEYEEKINHMLTKHHADAYSSILRNDYNNTCTVKIIDKTDDKVICNLGIFDEVDVMRRMESYENSLPIYLGLLNYVRETFCDDNGRIKDEFIFNGGPSIMNKNKKRYAATSIELKENNKVPNKCTIQKNANVKYLKHSIELMENNSIYGINKNPNTETSYKDKPDTRIWRKTDVLNNGSCSSMDKTIKQQNRDKYIMCSKCFNIEEVSHKLNYDESIKLKSNDGKIKIKNIKSSKFKIICKKCGKSTGVLIELKLGELVQLLNKKQYFTCESGINQCDNKYYIKLLKNFIFIGYPSCLTVTTDDKFTSFSFDMNIADKEIKEIINWLNSLGNAEDIGSGFAKDNYDRLPVKIYVEFNTGDLIYRNGDEWIILEISNDSGICYVCKYSTYIKNLSVINNSSSIIGPCEAVIMIKSLLRVDAELISSKKYSVNKIDHKKYNIKLINRKPVAEYDRIKIGDIIKFNGIGREEFIVLYKISNYDLIVLPLLPSYNRYNVSLVGKLRIDENSAIRLNENNMYLYGDIISITGKKYEINNLENGYEIKLIDEQPRTADNIIAIGDLVKRADGDKYIVLDYHVCQGYIKLALFNYDKYLYRNCSDVNCDDDLIIEFDTEKIEVLESKKCKVIKLNNKYNIIE